MAETVYDEHNECTVCGAHIADPHNPECPTQVAYPTRGQSSPECLEDGVVCMIGPDGECENCGQPENVG